jgi:uncharacterized protein YxjI
MNIRINSRAFSNGFDISTPAETLTTDNSSFGELLIHNSVGTQIARVVQASLFSSENNIIISGGGGYQFRRHGTFTPNWKCEGEGRMLEIREIVGRWFSARYRFAISDGAQAIAEFSRTLFSNRYEVNLLEEGDLKLVICMVIALSMSERSSDIPM